MTRLLTIVVVAAFLGTPCTATAALRRLSESRFQQRVRNQHPPGGRNPDRSPARSLVAKGSRPTAIRKPATTGMESPPGSILLSAVIPAADAGSCVNSGRNRA
jgi:hypothetical protein